VGFPPLEVPTLLRDFPTHSPTKFPTPLLGFPSLGGQNFAGTADGTIPSREQHRKFTKSSTCQIKHPRVEDQHSEKTWSIPNKTKLKQS